MMAAQPECRRCGDYVHSGLVVCEECSGILKDEMEALRAELTDATNQINELNEENNLLHDALTKLQARYDETEASSFQHLREKEVALAELEAARGVVSKKSRVIAGLNEMIATVAEHTPKMTPDADCEYCCGCGEMPVGEYEDGSLVFGDCDCISHWLIDLINDLTICRDLLGEQTAQHDIPF